MALAVALAIAAGGAVRVHAITPAEQSIPIVPPQEPRSHTKTAPVDHGYRRPLRHPEAAGAHKVPPAKGSGTVHGPKGALPAEGGAQGQTPVVVAPAPAPKPATEPPAKETGEPPPKIPRFAALKTDETNMRKGPGQRYPIEWVYKRRDLPMQVQREYDVWRYVRDPDGVEGWVHGVTLSDRRTFIVQNKDATLRADPKDNAAAVAMLKIGVIGRLRECAEGSAWCRVQVAGYKGYLRRDQFWGLLPNEMVPAS